MKEGELRDKLVKIFDKYEADDDQCCAVSDLIEEAKKEFPKSPFGMPNEKWDKKWNDWIEKILVWKEKWFK